MGGDSLASVTSWGGGSHTGRLASECPSNLKGPQARYRLTWRGFGRMEKGPLG